MTGEREMAQALAPFRVEVAALRDELKTVTAALVLFLARSSDVTHLTVPEVARVRKISRSAVLRQYRDSLETLTSNTAGIPIEKVFIGWMPLSVARRIVERMQKEAA